MLETHFHPVVGASGKVSHVIGLLSDITDRVRATAARDDLLARLDTLEAERRDLDGALRAVREAPGWPGGQAPAPARAGGQLERRAERALPPAGQPDQA